MQYFHKMFYNIPSSEERKSFANNRYNYQSTIKTGLEIKPIDQPNTFELFYVPTNQTMNLVQKIMIYDKDLDSSFHSLPHVALNKFLLKTITEELYSTNELEGVKSSRKELARSTKSIFLNKDSKNIRLHSLISSYLELINNPPELPNSAKDYRKIYDQITQGEIKETELPDGEIFRKDINYVFNKREKEIHRGISPESAIIEKISDLIAFMDKDDHELNYLIRVAVGHYYFGYIHPFYDGNGRTSRFISSVYLIKQFSLLTALSLARGCNINKLKYAEAFDKTNKIISSGELNFFVDEFLKTIIEGQKDLLIGLKEKMELLDIAYNKLKMDTMIETDDEFNMMFVFMQHYYFSLDSDGITVKDAMEVLEQSDATVRKKLKTMELKGLIKRIKSNPLVYTLPTEYLEN